MAWPKKGSQVSSAQRFVARGKGSYGPPAPLGAETTDAPKPGMIGPKSKQQVRSAKFEPKQSSFKPKGGY